MPDIKKIAELLSVSESAYLDHDPVERLANANRLVALLRNALHRKISAKEKTVVLEEAQALLKTETSPAAANNVLGSLVSIKQALDLDIKAAFTGDPSANSQEEVVESFPSIHALIHHRIAHQLYLADEKRYARLIAEAAHSVTGIDIHPGAQIGHGFFIDHGTGVVIGETTIIGTNVRLYQGVTLGAKSFRKDADGALIKGEPRHPVVEDDVIIYAHATILGRVRIGKGSIIGGNVWVTSDVAAGTRVLQTRANREVFRGYGDGI